MNYLIFPVDFYILDMDNVDVLDKIIIILGRPFMKMAKTKIDVFNGTLCMEYDGEVVKFNIHDDVIQTDKFSFNFLDTNNPLPDEDWRELSNRVSQELFLDSDFCEDTSKKELKRGKLGEKKLVVFKSLRKKAKFEKLKKNSTIKNQLY